MPDLPLVVGEGAGKNAADLFETLKPFDSVTKQMVAALRVGDRRWTLKLSSGVDIMLPDDGVADALKTLIKFGSRPRACSGARSRRRRSSSRRPRERAHPRQGVN